MRCFILDIEAFESLMLTVLLTGLCLFLLFIMFDLAKKANAGRFGTMVILGGLGLGMMAFALKGVIIEVLIG